MNIEDRINNSLHEIEYVLNQPVKVYFVNIVENSILINDDGLPNITVMKKELTENLIKEKLEYLMGSNVINLHSIHTVEGNERYYTFEFQNENVLSTYFYQRIEDITSSEILKLLKDIIE